MKQQRGFSIVSAIFILVILSLIGSYIVSISALTRSSGSLTSMGVKAYYAARSGLEWGTYIVAPLGGAGPFNCPVTSTVPLTQGGLAGFTATVSCVANSFTENGTTYKVFQITSQGQYGTPGSADYVSRLLYTTVVQPGV
jgi:MSHA biogenesis protein MshP